MKPNADFALPVGWAVAELGKIADVQLGKMLDRKRAEGTPLRYVRNINVRWDRIDTADLLEMPFKQRELDRYSLLPGDVLVCEGGEPGRAAVWQQDDPTIKYQKALHRVRMNGGLLPRWLVFHLYFDAQRGALARHFTGTTIKHFPREAIREYAVRIAPLGEQERIVEAVESHLTRIDDAVATLERVQRNLKRYRASVLKAAVEGRLVPTEAELARAEGRDYEPASVLLERILAERRRRWEEAELAKMKAKGKVPNDDGWKAKYEEPLGPYVSDLPSLPEGWCWSSVDQLVENHDRDRVPVKRADRAKRRGRYPYYGASGAIDRIDEYLFDGSFLLVGEDGANLLARSTPIAFQAHGQFWVNNHAHVLRTRLNLPLGYIEAFFNATELARYVTGTAQPKLPQAAMNKIPVPLCPAAEQFRVVDAVERQLSIADDVQVALDANTRRCKQLRQSILKWAFEGRLVDQDPTDEPAARLVERIQAERASEPAQPARTGRRARATKRDRT